MGGMTQQINGLSVSAVINIIIFTSYVTGYIMYIETSTTHSRWDRYFLEEGELVRHSKKGKWQNTNEAAERKKMKKKGKYLGLLRVFLVYQQKKTFWQGYRERCGVIFAFIVAIFGSNPFSHSFFRQKCANGSVYIASRSRGQKRCRVSFFFNLKMFCFHFPPEIVLTSKKNNFLFLFLLLLSFFFS